MIRIQDLTDREVLARTLWAEARNQGTEGMMAVASVILNRAKNPGWWGNSARTVCLKPFQFSCWNANDPQHNAIRADLITDRRFSDAMHIAGAALSGALPDSVHGADHYCTVAVAGRTAWAKGRTPVASVGTHRFYKIGLTA